MTIDNNEIVQKLFFINENEKTLQFRCNLDNVINELSCNGHTFLFMNKNLSSNDRKSLLINFLKRTQYHSYEIINKTELWLYFENNNK